LRKETIVIGRSSAKNEDIFLVSEQYPLLISRIHAVLTRLPSPTPSLLPRFSIRDNSTNGTFVNGVRIAKNTPQTLNVGDVVVFGALAPTKPGDELDSEKESEFKYLFEYSSELPQSPTNLKRKFEKAEKAEGPEVKKSKVDTQQEEKQIKKRKADDLNTTIPYSDEPEKEESSSGSAIQKHLRKLTDNLYGPKADKKSTKELVTLEAPKKKQKIEKTKDLKEFGETKQTKEERAREVAEKNKTTTQEMKETQESEKEQQNKSIESEQNTENNKQEKESEEHMGSQKQEETEKEMETKKLQTIPKQSEDKNKEGESGVSPQQTPGTSELEVKQTERTGELNKQSSSEKKEIGKEIVAEDKGKERDAEQKNSNTVTSLEKNEKEEKDKEIAAKDKGKERDAEEQNGDTDASIQKNEKEEKGKEITAKDKGKERMVEEELQDAASSQTSSSPLRFSKQSQTQTSSPQKNSTSEPTLGPITADNAMLHICECKKVIKSIESIVQSIQINNVATRNRVTAWSNELTSLLARTTLPTTLIAVVGDTG